MTEMKTLVLEASGTNSSAGIIGIVVGVVVVIGLIAAFVIGSRRKAKEPPPTVAKPTTDASGPQSADAAADPQPGAGSWSTPPSTPGEGAQGPDAPPKD
jgi:hypothetical protein